MHLTRAVGGEEHQWGLGRPHRAELGNRNLKLRQQLEEKAFELLVGAIDFVDQQDGRTGAVWIDGLKQRPLDEKGLAVELASCALSIECVGGVENAQFEELPRVVPLVQRVTHVQALVALQTNEIGAE